MVAARTSDHNRCQKPLTKPSQSYNARNPHDAIAYTLSGFEEIGSPVALRDLGLLDEVLACPNIVGLDGKGGFKVWGDDWTEWMSIRPRPLPRIPEATIRVARPDLRRFLLSHVRDEIRWRSMRTSAVRQHARI